MRCRLRLPDTVSLRRRGAGIKPRPGQLDGPVEARETGLGVGPVPGDVVVLAELVDRTFHRRRACCWGPV